MNVPKGIGIGFLILAGIIILMFLLSLVGLKFVEFFDPAYQDVERKVFEQTKSYTHGKIQDLASYYHEYKKSSQDEKLIIANVIKSQFADFEASKIREESLKSFLIEIRGY
ncbi:MAG: hypothetical protein ACXAAH_00315 [Promethearchaeota archaeon]|jgi:hypothetical protein